MTFFARTHQEVADELGISRVRVQQLEARALEKLRLALGVDDVAVTMRELGESYRPRERAPQGRGVGRGVNGRNAERRCDGRFGR